MPSVNYVLLEKITVGAAGASSVTFSGIPQTGYTDLVVKASARGTQASASHALSLRFNGSTTSYSSRELVGDGSAVSSASRGVFGSAMYIGNMDGNSATSNTFSNTEIYIPNYAGSAFKSVSVDAVSENNATEAYATLLAGLWSNTAAITSIDIVAFASHGTLMPNSTFYLYGVAKLGTTPAIYPQAVGGSTITTDGTYWYHTFLSSGTFTPVKSLTCDLLIIAGGAGGGGSNNGSIGGGGGAGGFQYLTSQSVGSIAYTVTVGAGGVGGGSGASGTAGSNSVFGALTASVGGGTGGGASGISAGFSGGNGGSGGGAGFSGSGASTVGGTGTAGQGNNGGNMGSGGGGAGGGGAGGAGTAPSGGAGTANSITGTSITYASGGQGTGSAGNGVVPANPTPNRGIGGDAGWNAAGANGGSGVVIVRYLV